MVSVLVSSALTIVEKKMKQIEKNNDPVFMLFTDLMTNSLSLFSAEYSL